MNDAAEPDKIVVGTDGSRSATAVVRAAASLAREVGAVVHVVAVQRGTRDQLAAASEVLGEAERMVRPFGVSTRLHPVLGRPSRVLCEIAEREHASLIVVGNRGTEDFLGVVQRPICKRVRRHARCSVLVVDTRDCWHAQTDDRPPAALAHAEPMPLRIDRAPDGPRLYLGGLRIHHGLTGELLALDGVRRRGPIGAVEAAVGALLLTDDWRDFPFPVRDVARERPGGDNRC
jgi:nucleotide-binding universal stress UspA family protein